MHGMQNKTGVFRLKIPVIFIFDCFLFRLFLFSIIFIFDYFYFDCFLFRLFFISFVVSDKLLFIWLIDPLFVLLQAGFCHLVISVCK